MKSKYFAPLLALALAAPSLKAQKTPEEKLNMTMYAITDMYVDTVDKASYVNEQIARMMKELDPFCAYLTPEEAAADEAALLGPTASGAPIGYRSTVQTAYMASRKTGYIRLTMFAESTLAEFKEAAADLQKQGAKNLIVDLQGNPGGFFDSAVALADEFLDGDKTIVTVSGAHIPSDVRKASAAGCFEKGRVALLVNEKTMSAAEIFSGALRDWDRAVLIGTDTFGKGLIQETLPFEDGSALRITVARYFTPAGMSIQKPYDGYGGLFADGSAEFKSLKNGRTLKSGGGIAADIIVPRDTSFMNNWYFSLSYNGFQKFEVQKYLDAHKDDLLKKYKDAEAFYKGFAGEEEMFAELTSEATAAGLPFDQAQHDAAAKGIKAQLKALLARQLYRNNGYVYYKILNSVNPAVEKALEILESNYYEETMK